MLCELHRIARVGCCLEVHEITVYVGAAFKKFKVPFHGSRMELKVKNTTFY